MAEDGPAGAATVRDSGFSSHSSSILQIGVVILIVGGIAFYLRNRTMKQGVYTKVSA